MEKHVCNYVSNLFLLFCASCHSVSPSLSYLPLFPFFLPLKATIVYFSQDNVIFLWRDETKGWANITASSPWTLERQHQNIARWTQNCVPFLSFRKLSSLLYIFLKSLFVKGISVLFYLHIRIVQDLTEDADLTLLCTNIKYVNKCLKNTLHYFLLTHLRKK